MAKRRPADAKPDNGAEKGTKGKKTPLTIQAVEMLWSPGGGDTSPVIATAPDEQAPATDDQNDQGAKNTRDRTQAGRQTDTNEQVAVDQLASPNATQTRQTTRETTAGDASLAVAETAAAYTVDLPESLPLARARDGETKKQCWERLRQEARTAGMTRRDSISYAGIMVEQVWIAPPPPEPEPIEEPIATEPEVSAIVDTFEANPPGVFPEVPSAAILPQPIAAEEGVPGLGTIPEDWPQLPANSSLQAEISWVSANRLRVRDGSGVDLSRALSPAPSYSALSWLETSILFPSKFADISVKATQNQEDEQTAVRRERMAIEEIRALLAEMMDG